MLTTLVTVGDEGGSVEADEVMVGMRTIMVGMPDEEAEGSILAGDVGGPVAEADDEAPSISRLPLPLFIQICGVHTLVVGPKNAN